MRHLGFISPAYLKSISSLKPFHLQASRILYPIASCANQIYLNIKQRMGADPQLLSIVDIQIEVQKAYMNMAKGNLVSKSLLQEPFVSDSMPSTVITDELKDVLAFLRDTNPLVQSYLTMAEREHPTSGAPYPRTCAFNHAVFASPMSSIST